MITPPPSPPTAVREFGDFWEALRQLLPLPLTPATSQDDAPAITPLEEALELSLQRIIEPARVSCTGETLRRYGTATARRSCEPEDTGPRFPAAVVFPNSEQEIAQLLMWAEERDLRLLPWGGGAAPYLHKQLRTAPYIVVDLRYLNRVLDLAPQQQEVRVQSGVTWTALEAYLAQHKLTSGQCFPWDPATVGGAVATQSVSVKALRYGDLHQNVLAIRALCPAGPIRLRPARPGAADERGLMLGTFGAWGIVTEVSLRLHPIPAERVVLMAGYNTWGEALAKLELLRQAEKGVAAARIVSTREMSLFADTATSSIRRWFRQLLGSAAAEFQLILDLEGTHEEVGALRRQSEEVLHDKDLKNMDNGRETQPCQPDYAPYWPALQKLWEQHVLAHMLTAVVPWHDATPFLRDWEEALRSILLTTGGRPGQVLTTAWAAPEYVMLRTLLLGFRPENASDASPKQIEDIQAVALAIKQHWHIEEPPAQLVTQALGKVSETLDPNNVMLR